jgi:hypothetical protein
MYPSNLLLTSVAEDLWGDPMNKIDFTVTVPGHWLIDERRRVRYASNTVTVVGTLSKEARDLLDMAECYRVDPHTLVGPRIRYRV